MPPAPTGRAARRRRREREIVDATRRLFDERGLQDAPMEQIARAVGINKAVIYRHFESKEELFVLTVTRYLDELAATPLDVDEDADPVDQLRAFTDRFARFCLAYPAFLDCAMSLMRRPAAQLRLRVSDAVWFRLGQGMAGCLDPLSRVLAAGAEQGAFDVDDPDFVANHLWTAALGTMHLARIGVGVRLAAPGAPAVFSVDPERVRQACVESALAFVTAGPRGRLTRNG
jgi:AcrR family transcriptional regulator